MCLIMGGFDNTITLKAQLREQNAWTFVYQDEGQGYKGRAGHETPWRFLYCAFFHWRTGEK